MTNSLLIGKLIYTKLNEALDSTKIYPLVAENGTTYPYVVYFRTNINVQGISKDGYCLDIVTYNIVAISDRYDESVEIANEIRRVMEKKKLITDDLVLHDNKLISATERYADNAYIQELTFECKIDNN